ncbi:MAG: SPASM domain-containing protein, partial [Porphyromonadaceae bacterium]|nr:SPASM domain-containing protein [Porphyromonadaceae bacterium]
TQKNISNPHVTFEGCMIYAAYPNIDGSIVKTEYQKKQYGCECGNTILEILADGSMYSCASYISSGQIIGNAFHQNWKEIWDNSELLNQLRYKKCTDSICVKCSLYHFCNGGCPAYKQLKKQDIYSSCDDRCLIHKTKLQQ